MRSPQEIRFRLRQELANVVLWALPPSLGRDAHVLPLRGLPDPESVARVVRGTQWASAIAALANRIVAGHVPLLGTEIDTGSRVVWRRDYLSGIETPPAYFRRVPYLDASRAGDHKNIWELSRHQHLVLCAQAFLLTGEERYSRYVEEQLRSWWNDNPFQRGINWASALEVAFRALSWIWILHLMGPAMDAAFRRRFMTELYRHGLHLEYNLSIYFSPNTHLLGEAVALHAIGALFPQLPRAGKWRDLGRRVVLHEFGRQVHADGSYFEQSTYYHVYALDMLMLHHAIEAMPDSGVRRLGEMADFLRAVTSADGYLPFLGDDDGGRLFHPFGDRHSFARATLATCSVVLGRSYFDHTRDDLFDQAVWWFGPRVLEARLTVTKLPSSRHFGDAGLISMRAGETHVLFDAGPFGPGNAGHSHSDTLSFVVRSGDEDVLIDPGTYTYVGDAESRDLFRGSAAHNAVRVDGRDQADPAGPFRWLNKPEAEVKIWKTAPDRDFLDAVCRSRGIQHHRRVWFSKPDLLVIVDEIEGEGEHEIEQFWHPGGTVTKIAAGRWRIGSIAELAVSEGMKCEVLEGWRSDALASKRPAPVIRVSGRCVLPVRMIAVVRIGGEAPVPVLEGDTVRVGGSLFLNYR